ncbi:hypothetical protein [Bradyrhizobium nanningense]|uniref:hypothetical protein n=1 Tax=Bradyrhizobium nanningense TaxID=1325118 RepID=UPI001FDFCC5D|nr:hypothetical protein [Bradyrhizobium nanningense]
MLPLIAVLPFRAMNADSIEASASDAALGDWLAEEVCRSLCRSNLIAVISHWSSRALDHRTVDVTTVRSRLAADYCVAGTMRVHRGEIILDADFVDTVSGRILWTRQFAGRASDYLGRCSEGVVEIVRAIGGTLADDAIKHVAGQCCPRHCPLDFLAGRFS